MKSTDILEEHITSIFMVKEYAKQETSMKQAQPCTTHVIESLFSNSAVIKL
jgi:hypothetical protein